MSVRLLLMHLSYQNIKWITCCVWLKFPLQLYNPWKYLSLSPFFDLSEGLNSTYSFDGGDGENGGEEGGDSTFLISRIDVGELLLPVKQVGLLNSTDDIVDLYSWNGSLAAFHEIRPNTHNQEAGLHMKIELFTWMTHW